MSEVSKKVDVAGLRIDAITKSELLQQITNRIQARQKTFVVTPYSEFLYASLRDNELRSLFNSANFSIADGVGVLWANLFLSVSFTVKSFYGKILQAWWQVVWTGASILLNPKKIYMHIPEKIVGADLIWDLAALAEKNSFSVYLLGGWGDTTMQAKTQLIKRFPNLRIAGYSNKNHDDASIIDDINAVCPHMLFVALGPIRQEQWISENLSNLNVTFAIGLGGTFDYIAGTKKQPPKFIRTSGLEWLYRLVTQPSRFMRIYQGFAGLILALVRYKVFNNMPLRLNASIVVVNSAGNILMGKRAADPFNVEFHGAHTIPDVWHFPQGGIEAHETVIEGAQRELMEETKIHSVQLIGEAKYKNIYIWNNATRKLLKTKTYPNKGQDQRTVFFKFTGDSSEIKLDQRELTGYVWVPAQDVISMLAPFRQQHAAAVLQELAELQKIA